MNGNAKWRFRILGLLRVLGIGALAGASLWLLSHYLQYGQAVREAGTKPVKESGISTPGDDGASEDGREEDSSGNSGNAVLREKTSGSSGDPENAALQGEPLPERIRVRILGDGFGEAYHELVEVTSGGPFTVSLQGEDSPDGSETSREKYQVKAGESCRIVSADLREGEALCIRQSGGAPLTVKSLTRADGHPQYEGTLFLYRRPEGIALVNELPLEDYVRAVVSSEMPSDYPLEAQKAQAVCARTYARNCILSAEKKDPLADLDDSVNYQVYNNYRATENSGKAAEETKGETLPLAEVLYYSTSCQTERREDLGSDSAFRDFLSREPDVEAEYGSAWLRWETEVSARQILDALADRFGWEAESIDGISVAERSGNGQAQELLVRSGKKSRKIRGEYEIRRVLSPGRDPVTLLDGQKIAGMQLLPSAFFWLEPKVAEGAARSTAEGLTETPAQSGRQETGSESALERAGETGSVTIHGGGYGHGVGMSQCGAAAMAKAGMDYREILAYYYGCSVDAHGQSAADHEG